MHFQGQVDGEGSLVTRPESVWGPQGDHQFLQGRGENDITYTATVVHG